MVNAVMPRQAEQLRRCQLWDVEIDYLDRFTYFDVNSRVAVSWSIALHSHVEHFHVWKSNAAAVFLYQISSSTYFCLANSFLDGCPFGSAQVVHRSFLTWQTRWSGQLRWRPKTSSSSSMGSLGCTPRRLICWGSHTGWLWCRMDIVYI